MSEENKTQNFDETNDEFIGSELSETHTDAPQGNDSDASNGHLHLAIAMMQAKSGIAPPRFLGYHIFISSI